MKAVVSSLVLLACLAMPAYAFFPEWPRTHVGNIGPVGTILSHDFNGDGRADVVSRRTDHVVILSLAQAGRSFAAPAVIYTGTYLTDLVLGDANGDGHTDLVVSDTGTNSLVVVPSNGNATFGTPIVTALAMAPTEIAAGDFDEDGAIDVAVRSFSASLLLVFTGDGAGHFAEVWRTAIDSSVNWVVAGDIDGDGADDFLVRTTTPTNQYVLYFGHGDTTFDPPVSIPASATPVRLALGDLDDDGDLEIISTEIPSSVRVIVNNGSRTFAAPSDYSTVIPAGGNAGALVVAEVTGDDHVDVVTALLTGRRLVTLAGNGNGTLRTPEYAPVPSVTPFTSMFPERLTAGDYTGDGRIDLAATGSNHLALFANAAGDGTLELDTIHPTISTDQSAKFELRFWIVDGFQLNYPDTPPYPTGTVTLMNGETPVATGSFENYVATIEVPSLPAGTHSITASFAGDENYRAMTSDAVTQKVVAGKTTVTLTGIDEEVPYGQYVSMYAHVTSEIPEPLDGMFWLYVDGVRTYSASTYNPSFSFHVDELGTDEYYVTYEGSATQPPSVSEVYRQTVTMAQSVVEFANHYSNRILRYGETVELEVELSSEPWSVVPQGTVRLFDGSTLLATKQCCSGRSVFFDLPVLSPGVHHLRATYDGSELFKPSVSDHERFTILPAEGFVLDVYAAGDGDSTVINADGLSGLQGGGYFKIYRRIGNQPWTLVSQYSSYPAWSVSDPDPGVLYSFRMEAYDQGDNLVASSNTDAAMHFSFSDKLITSGMRIKAQQIQETVAATNVLRATAGLAPFTLAGAAAGQTVRLAHLTSLRTAIHEARAALGIAPIVFSNDATAGSVIQARHFQELRDTMQ